MKVYFKLLFIFIVFFSFSIAFALPANDSFIDDDLYKCIIDAYNFENDETKNYTDVLEIQELIEIKNLNCSNYKGKIDDLTGLNKMTGLEYLNLSGNTFIGGSLKIDVNGSGSLKSNIKLPSQLSLTDIQYIIDNEKIVKVENGVVKGLSSGSTYVTKIAKVTGNEIKEKYLVSVTSNDSDIKKSNNANLAALSITNSSIDFKTDTKLYNAIVAKSVGSVTINAKLADSKASFVTGYGPRSVSLKEGANVVYIKVKAENGDVNTYTLNITRTTGDDGNNYLSNLIVSPGKIDFSRETLIYTFSVDSDVDHIEVKPVTESFLANAEVSNTDLKYGENKIIITVTADNGDIKKYQLNVYREEYESEKNFLKSLVISDYEIGFLKRTYEYDITINKEDSLDIKAVVENDSSSLEIIGNANLKNNSKIIIRVTDEDGFIRDYNIFIHKSLLNTLTYKEYILIIEFITIIVLIIVAISNNRKRRMAGKYIPTNVSKNKVCSNCGTINSAHSKICYVCGKKF